MRRLVVVLTLVAGCDFTFNLDHLKDPDDGAVGDGDGSGVDALTCYGLNGAGSAGLTRYCLDHDPPETWTPNGELHTGMFTNTGDCMAIGDQSGTNLDVCVIYARNITLGGYLPTSGGRPVVFIATETFTLLAGATIAADTRSGSGRRGPDANDSDCSMIANGTNSTTGASGGAGGSFGGIGGNGGRGAGASPGPLAAPAVTGVGYLRGGCKGGDGGSGFASTPTGDGGASGGAVYVIAGERIDIAGTIDASGQAGGGGNVAPSAGTGGDGGGGGGSGGLIGLDSPRISIASTAILVANGGGGGGGGGGVSGTAGTDGTEAQLLMPTAFPAAGGNGGSAGAGGGDGASGTAPATPGGPNGANVARSAGGGGGGGAGIIKFFSPVVEIQSSNISPPAT